MRAAAAAPGCLRRLFSRTYSVNYPWVLPRREPKPSNRLRIDGLNYITTSRGLFEAFQKFGGVVNARVMTDRSGGYCEGYGYVTFATVEDAIKGKEGMRGEFLDRFRLFPVFAKPSSPRKKNGAPQSGQNNGTPPDGHQ